MCWASAPGYSPAIVATTWRGRSVVSSAHSTTAPRDRSQPSRPARRTISTGSISGRERSSSRNEPRRFCSTSSRASSTATSVRQATAARCRNSSAVSSASPNISTRPIVSSPVVIGTSPPTSGGTEAGRPRARSLDVAPQRPDVDHRARRQRRRAEPRDHDRHGGAGRLGGQLRDAREPLAGQHRVHHLQVDRAQALDEGRATRPRPAGSGGPHQSDRGLRPRRPTPAPRSPDGPATSPHRTPRCGSCRPPRPA